jgi:hypothetical protein
LRIPEFFAVALACGAAAPALGHHSDAGYDQERIIGLQGTVTRFLWRNPHITVYVETEDESGATAEWGIETGSTPIMTRSGWTRDMFAPGDVVTVRAHPDRRHRTHAMMISIEASDGSVWIQDESDTPATASATSLEGVWKGIGETLGPFGRALNDSSLTAAGVAAKASYNFQTDSPIRDCTPPPAPGSVVGSTVYLNGFELLEDRVIIRSEFFDAVRTVYTDGREHPVNGERTNQGHSIGWWEGDVLVVDTVQFADHRSANGNGVPSGPNKHLVERFSLSDDGTRMIVEVELNDPDYLAEPFVGRKELLYTPHLQLYRYNCDPELSREAGFE